MDENVILEKDLRNKYRENAKRREQFSYGALYSNAVNDFNIDENIIFYESGFGKNTTAGPYSMFRTLYQDRKYKNYTHIWSLESLSGEVYNAFKRKKNVKFVIRKSKEYFEFLAKAKYVINNRQMPFYYGRRDGQYYIRLVQKFDDFMFKKRYFSIKEMNYLRNLYQASHIVFDNEKIKEKVMSVDRFGDTYTGNILVHEIKKWDAVHEKPSKFAEIIGEAVILSDKNSPFEKNNISQKKNILFYPGKMQPGGLTNSMISFLNMIDYNKNRVYFVADKTNSQEEQEQFERINPKAAVFVRYGTSGYQEDEYVDVQKLDKSGLENDAGKEKMEGFYRREIKRICGRDSFDCAIDFSGFELFWSCLTGYSNSKKKHIFMHTDMKKEAERMMEADEIKGTRLLNLFSLYPLFDRILAVSSGCLEINKEILNEETRCKMDFIFDGADASEILNLAENQTHEISVDGNEYSVVEEKNTGHRIHLNGYRRVAKDKYNFICIGKLSEEKDYGAILESFFQAKKKNSNLALYIVGEGEEQKSIESQISNLGLEDDVIMTGYLKNPYVLLKQCDCLVICSKYEGFGLPVLEAAILEKQIIASDIPGLRDIVAVCGGMLVQGGQDALAETFVSLAGSKNEKNSGFDFEKYHQSVAAKIQNLILDLE